MNKFAILILFLISLITTQNVEISELQIYRRDVFPHSTNKSFSLIVARKDGDKPILSSISSTLVILIRDENDRELSKAIFDYGFKDMIDQEYKSEFMTIPTWTIQQDRSTINATILFSRKANNKWLEVYQLLAQTMPERRQMLQNLKDTSLLMSERLNLLVPPRIDLNVLSPDERKNELMPMEIGTATCRSSDGIPPEVPIFVGLHEFNVKKVSFDEKNNERTLQFLVSLADHEKRLRCIAGNSEASSVIYVMHHPTQVILKPEPGRVIENGSEILCNGNGYPASTVHWTFISGPRNTSHFFSTSDNGARFHLSKDAPLRSRWIVNCSATNIIRQSVGVYNRTVTFTVGRPQEGLLVSINLTTQIIIVVVVVVSIVLFSVMIVCIVSIVRRRASHRGAAGTTGATERNNGSLQTKASPKNKDTDIEHMTPLLLPSAPPPQYCDLTIPGTSPLPPPEYKTRILEEEGDRSISPAQCQDYQDSQQDLTTVPQTELPHVEMCPAEVTYAEISTSDLPMRDGCGTSTACTAQPSSPSNEDHVIYSQIVGTVVTQPYHTQHSVPELNNV